jgi:ATP-binding protein involved in chromosome partitioning
MSQVTSDQVRAALQSVLDPATERDIVTGRQLGDITVGDDGIRLHVDLISPGYPLRGALENSIRSALDRFALPVQFDWGLKIPRKPARQDLDRVPTIKNVIAVAAGKGGVGKSTVSVNLALALQRLGARVGVLDADVFGPSIPQMLGPASRLCDKSVSGQQIIPALHRGMPVMSLDFFVEAGKAVMWRGPMIHKLLQQFLEDVVWGELDYLIIDLPPGTGDVQLSLSKLLPITGAVIVTTPQEVALLDVRKAIDMFRHAEIPVLGVIENMSHYRCPACGHVEHVFSAGGGRALAADFGVPLLGELPLESAVSTSGELGNPVVSIAPDSDNTRMFLSVAANVALAAAKLQGVGPVRSSMLRTV